MDRTIGLDSYMMADWHGQAGGLDMWSCRQADFVLDAFDSRDNFVTRLASQILRFLISTHAGFAI
jgi:hypothetical protein